MYVFSFKLCNTRLDMWLVINCMVVLLCEWILNWHWVGSSFNVVVMYVGRRIDAVNWRKHYRGECHAPYVSRWFFLVYTEWDMMSLCEPNRKLRLKKIFLPSNGTTNYVQSTRSSVFAWCGLWSFTGGVEVRVSRIHICGDRQPDRPIHSSQKHRRRLLACLACLHLHASMDDRLTQPHHERTPLPLLGIRRLFF